MSKNSPSVQIISQTKNNNKTLICVDIQIVDHIVSQ